ncbi:MAG: cytochrome P450 [Paenibacillus dendritiformis]|uniref:cytochrome P450 family protein n=1 Tax=Paenibacillus dendritiformis TaxID=130049 RepID=UPI001B06CE94|nr:cytochrome P450 [Paenibacillus dendritiformis]MDU5142936.1 cytochrome P450 [Paenibacillus dendritiformis]GIO75850.1 cytochrome P450 [Paenibacillus dendritiformis]
MATSPTVPTINPFSSDFKDHAYALYEKLREHDPLHRITLPNGRTAWIVTRYKDAAAALKADHLKKNLFQFVTPDEMGLPPSQMDLMTRHMLNSDPPDHTRLRGLVQKAFTPRMIERLKDRIQGIADGLLDQVEDQASMDLIQDYAYPLPIIVICEMLGLPAEERDQFRQWSHALVSAINVPEKYQQIGSEIDAFTDYITALIEKRRRDPKEDLLSLLVQAESEGDALSEKELISTILLLIIAGHETTVNLIGNGIFTLLTHPDELEALRNAPSLMESAIEELLRFMGPVEFATNRWIGEDYEWNGKLISKGDMVLVALASANRDPEYFKQPDRLILSRERNHHIAFGLGIHHCLGAPLARLEGRIAIGTLLQRRSRMKLAVPPERLEWQPTYLMRGFASLPLQFQ